MKYIFSLIFIVAAVSIFVMYTKPTYDGLSGSQQQIARYNIALAKVADLEKQRDVLIQKYNALDQQTVARLEKFIPDHVDNIGLILDIDGIASRHGIALQNIDVGGGGSNNSNPEKTTTAIQSGPSPYSSLVIRFTVQGTYEMLRAFLGDLQSSLRLVTIESLGLNPGAAQPGVASERLYTMTVALRTYWIK